MYDVLIVGCGVTGAAVAYQLSRYNLSVAVIEKEDDVAMGATRANSAIIHAGYDPENGTLMAKLNVRGNALAEEICKKLDVPYKKIGSYVLAFSEEEAKTVETLYERGVKNGVPGLAIHSAEEIRKIEPRVSEQVVCGLWAPSAGVIAPWDYALAMAEVAVQNGAKLYTETELKGIEKTENGWKIGTNRGAFEARYVINCAGVYADDVHNLVAAPSFKVTPNKGQYYLMDKSEGEDCSHVLFQCPSAVGKGVLVSPTVHGNLIVGPDATPALYKEDTAVSSDRLAFVRNAAAKTIPDINYRNSIRNFCGVRANTDQSDFIIDFAAEGFLDVAGIKSPGLSAAPAIGEYVAELLEKDGLKLEKKENFVDERRVVRFKELSAEEKNAMIRENPAYGRVICRCETITEGEIVAALHRPIPATTVDGVKRRCNAGMGRCQGGFCGPKVLDLIARETGCDPITVRKDKNGSEILIKKL